MERFEAIRRNLIGTREGVEAGPMMSSEGIRYGGKVFAFWWAKRGAMVFRLGRSFDPDAEGLEEWEPLSPFRTKPPLAGWYVVPDGARWEELAARALDHMAGGAG